MSSKNRYFAAYVPQLNQTWFRSSPTMVYTGIKLNKGRTGIEGFTTKGCGDVKVVEITKESFNNLLNHKLARVQPLYDARRAECAASGKGDHVLERGWGPLRVYNAPSESWVHGDLVNGQVVLAPSVSDY